MAIVGPSRHARVSMSVSMSLMQGPGGAAAAPQGGLHAAQPYYPHHPQQHAVAPAHSQEQVQPDRPIGYGAFGVVWAVTDPRDGRRVALKKLPNVFQSLVSSKRVFRELKMLCFFKHENVSSAGRPRYSAASPPRLFPGDIRHHGAVAKRPAQDHRVASAALLRPHQGLSLSDPARFEVSALGAHSAPRHQARQPAGEQQLRAEDLRLWAGAGGGARHQQAHDARGGDAVLPRPRDPDGGQALHGRRRCVVGRVHFRRAARQAHPLPGAESGGAARADHRAAGHAHHVRHEVRVRGRQGAHAAAQPQAAQSLRPVHAVGAGVARGRPPAVSDAGFRSGE
ncbi:hypothetical protein D910_07189 [Dendroctonus ponderosae]|uniref:Protein kinase domain-containing protein n=1 Tax=Dendroctonus ponderosae TaxID=77166 RepID=U4U7H7_DENPD|nr:hypothetical protein D910_07189 [Dendroctonus ponderosae]